MSLFKWLGTAAKNVGAWIGKIFTDIRTEAAPVAVTILTELQSLWATGAPGYLASLLDTLTKSGIPAEVVTAIGDQIPKMLATALAVEGLPANPTQQDILDFEQRVLAAFKVTDSKSQLYTTLAAQIYGLIQANVNAGSTFTFAELVADVEAAYKDYQADLAANPPATN